MTEVRPTDGTRGHSAAGHSGVGPERFPLLPRRVSPRKPYWRAIATFIWVSLSSMSSPLTSTVTWWMVPVKAKSPA